MQSKHGRALVVISKDQELAGVMGINVVRYKVLSFAVGSFISGIGAALWCHQVLMIRPQALSLHYAFQLVAMIAISGIGTLSGPVIGAAILMIGTELITPLQEGFTVFGMTVPPAFGAINVFTAVLLIIIMIFRPKGLMNGKELWEHFPRIFGLKKQSDS